MPASDWEMGPAKINIAVTNRTEMMEKANNNELNTFFTASPDSTEALETAWTPLFPTPSVPTVNIDKIVQDAKLANTGRSKVNGKYLVPDDREQDVYNGTYAQ